MAALTVLLTVLLTAAAAAPPRALDVYTAEQVAQTVHRLVSEIIPPEHPPTIRAELRKQATSLLLDSLKYEPLVADALRLWTRKSVHPKALPALFSEVINARNGRPSTTDALIAQTQALKNQLPNPPELLP
jgi:hypothetical protein